MHGMPVTVTVHRTLRRRHAWHATAERLRRPDMFETRYHLDSVPEAMSLWLPSGCAAVMESGRKSLAEVEECRLRHQQTAWSCTEN